MMTISEMKQNYIKKDFIVDNLMKSNGIYCLVARPKVGKSMFCLQLANAIANGTTFLGHKTSPSPVLYISTEMDFSQLYDRILKMNLHLTDDNFRVEDQYSNDRKLNLFDLKLQFQDFAELGGKFVIIDMFTGVSLNNGYNLNDYQDMGQYVFPYYKDLCKQYGFTFLLVHHLNKNNTSLGSTAIDGSVDGIITLKKDLNVPRKVLLKYESRDYEQLELMLNFKDNLLFEVSEFETEDLNPILQLFLNYAIKQKDFNFTVSEITSKLNLQITPTKFGKLLNNNMNNLAKEGLHIEQKRTATERIYTAHYEEPFDENR